MEDSTIHRQLKRQIAKFLPQDLVDKHPEILQFINAVNLSYQSFERDAELSELSSRLNDKEYFEINSKIKQELEQKIKIHSELIAAIKQISDAELKLDTEDSIIELIDILKKQIESKKEFQSELFLAKINAEKANNAKSDFLSVMSHEMRTPLNAIIGLIYIMEKENTFSSFTENIGSLKYSAQNLYLLINNILDFSKIEAGKIDIEQIPFDFKELIMQIGKSLEAKAKENGNKIEIHFDDESTPNIISDPLRLGQIITNLVSNAVKFTKEGLIQIKVIQIDKNNEISKFEVQISDTGIGIEESKFEHIFQQFEQAEKSTTRKFGGTGLGLIISKKLLQLLNSDIDLQSEVGVGSTFSFKLEVPYFAESVGLNTDVLFHDYKEANLEGMSVLLVDDNIINVKVAQKILSHWNIKVDIALNGIFAIEKFKANKYDVILMDLAMPVMDGYEATSIIRSNDSSIPIIALTASASYGYLEKAIYIGINEYVIKPFNPKELNLKLRKYYKKKM